MTADKALVRDIYAAALGDRPWRDVLARTARQLDATGSFLFTTFQSESAGGLCVSHGMPDAVARQFLTEVSTVDVWFQALLRRHGSLASGFQWQTDDLVPDQEMRRTRMFADYLVPCDVGRNLGIILSGSTASLDVVPLCFYRPVRSRPFDAGDAALLADLGTHFTQALAVRQRLGAAALDPARLAIERVSIPVVVVARDRCVLLANPAADRLFAATSPSLVVGGRLRAQQSSAHAALERAIQACATYQFDAQFSLSVRLGGPPGRGVVARLAPPPPATAQAGRAAAVVFLSQEACSPPDLRSLVAMLYRLTPAEVELVQALCDGLTPEAFAEQRGVGIATIRTQLRSVFSKTGTRRQTDLMRLVFSVAH